MVTKCVIELKRGALDTVTRQDSLFNARTVRIIKLAECALASAETRKPRRTKCNPPLPPSPPRGNDTCRVTDRAVIYIRLENDQLEVGIRNRSW